MIGYGDTDLERLYEYGRFLLPRLPRRDDPGVDIGEVQVSHLRIQKTGDHDLELKPEGPQLIDGFLTGSSTLRNEQDEESLAEVIRRINAEYGANLSTSDQILIGQVVAAVADNPQLAAVALKQDEETFGRELAKDLDRIVIEQAASNETLIARYFNEEEIGRIFQQVATQQAYRMIRRPARREAERRVANVRNTGIPSIRETPGE